MINTSRTLGYNQGKADGYALGRVRGFEQAQADLLQAFIEAENKKNEALLNESCNVLVVTSSSIPSLEIGILQPFNHLLERGDIHYTLISVSELSKELIESVDRVVFMRTVESKAFKFLEIAHEMNKNTIYYIDDHFMAIDPDTSIGMYYLEPKRLRTYVKFLKHSKKIKVDSQYFAQYIRDHFNPHVHYFPGSVDFALLDQLQKPPPLDHCIVIGYEGGEKDKAFKPVVPALLKILDYYGGLVRLEFMGYTPEKLIGHPSVISHPPDPDYRRFLTHLYLRNWDIGLAPLEDNQFNHCKTNNKFREYAACRIAGIYSNIPPYADWVTHEENGYLVQDSTEQWYEAISTLIDNHALRQLIIDNAEQIARAHFTIDACAERWKNELLLKEGE